MKVTAEQINSIMHESIGSMTAFKRSYGKYMDYTEGVMNVQRKLSMYWFIDLMYSLMIKVVDDYCITEESFYVVKLTVSNDHTAVLDITREEYNEDTDEYKDIVVAREEIDYTDLPQCEMKFFLELANLDPLVFRLLCPSEH